MDYTTVDELRMYLDKVGETPSNLEALEKIVTRASALVRDALVAILGDPQFDFVAAWPIASTKIVKAYGGELLALPPHNAGSVTLVEEQTGSNPATYTAITDEWLEEGLSLYREAGWTWYQPLRYRITASWGYGPVPASIEEIVLELAVNLWRSREKGSFTQMIGVEGQGQIMVVSALTRDQQAALSAWAAPYRRVPV